MRAAIAIACVLTASTAQAESYPALLDRIGSERLELARRLPGPALRQRARTVLLAETDRILDAWKGTPWAFHGTSETPQRGTIACGYFVTTVLRDLGFRIERVALAQLASEYIVQTFAPSGDVARFSNHPAADVVAHVRKAGDSLWIVGLDFHVGFLRVRGAEVSFCHASYVDPVTVVCEDPLSSRAFASRYRVVGRLFGDAMLDAWLAGRPIETVRPKRRGT